MQTAKGVILPILQFLLKGTGHPQSVLSDWDRRGSAVLEAPSGCSLELSWTDGRLLP